MSGLAPLPAVGATDAAAALPLDGEIISGPVTPSHGPGFADMVADGLNKMNDQLVASQVDLQRLASGDMQNLHQVMIRLEETRLSFQLMMKVRSGLLEAYQDVMKMQV